MQQYPLIPTDITAMKREILTISKVKTKTNFLKPYTSQKLLTIELIPKFG